MPNFLADGLSHVVCRRFYLEIVGRRRFRITEAGEQDGYRMALPQYFIDSPVSDPEQQLALRDLAVHVEALADQWIERFRCVSRGGLVHFSNLHLCNFAS